MKRGAFSDYYDEDGVAAAVKRGDHRKVVGGLWNEVGELQMRFLKENGLRPSHTLLDIGCGSLRLGVRAVGYLEAGKYWGTDINVSLLEAGFDQEIVSAGLAYKLPRSNLVCDAHFQFEGVPKAIDFAIATSVFTHLPFNHIRLCLANLARHVLSPCTFLFTAFMPPKGRSVIASYVQPGGGILTHSHRDPYHYTEDDFRYAVTELPWSLEIIGDWGHPRNQMMLKAVKA